MSDNSTTSPGFDRRRFIKGAGAGVALAWTAPIITGMNARAFAAGSEPLCGTTLADNFDQEGEGQDWTNGYVTITALQNFTVTGGNIDVIGSGGSGGGFDLVPGNGYYLDLDGTNNASSIVTLTSKQGFCKGAYTVSVTYAGDHRGDGDNTITASMGGGTFSDSPSSGTGSTTQSFTANVLVDGEKLIITNDTGQAPGDNQGVLLLEVSVTP